MQAHGSLDVKPRGVTLNGEATRVQLLLYVQQHTMHCAQKAADDLSLARVGGIGVALTQLSRKVQPLFVLNRRRHEIACPNFSLVKTIFAIRRWERTAGTGDPSGSQGIRTHPCGQLPRNGLNSTFMPHRFPLRLRLLFTGLFIIQCCGDTNDTRPDCRRIKKVEDGVKLLTNLK